MSPLKCSLSGLILLVIGAHAALGPSCKPQCPKSPCFSYSIKKCVEEMWNFPKDKSISPNLKELKGAISSLLPQADDRRKGYLVAISLWSVNALTDMHSPQHATCVYGNLLNQTAINKLTDSCCARNGLKKANEDLGNHFASGIGHSIYLGLKDAGCPAETPIKNNHSTCALGSTPQILNSLDSMYKVPAKLKPILLKMSTSCNPTERAIAASSFGSATKINLDYFEKALQEEVFVKSVQLKACRVKIKKKCCGQKEEELKYWVNALAKYATKFFNEN